MDFLQISSIFCDFDRFVWFAWIPGCPISKDGAGGLLTNSPLVVARLVRRQDMRSQGGFPVDFIDFLGFSYICVDFRSGAPLTNSPLVLARLVRRQDLRSRGAFSMDFKICIDFMDSWSPRSDDDDFYEYTKL